MKKLLANLANGYNLEDLKLLFLQLGLVVVFSILAVWLINKKQPNKLSYLFAIAVATGLAFVVAISKNSVPLALLSVAAAILVVTQTNKKYSQYALFIFVGFGCGSGNVLITLAVAAVLLIPAIFFFNATSVND